MNDPGTGKEKTNQNEGKSGAGTKKLSGTRAVSGGGPTSSGGINRPTKKSSYH